MNLKLVLNELKKFYKNKKGSIINFKFPKEIKTILDLSLDTKINDDEYIKIINKIIIFSIKSHKNMFFNQLFGGTNEYVALADMIVSMLNTSMYTYEMAPVFSIMETIISKKVLSKFNIPNGDLLMLPGGSMCNMYAIHLAQYYKYKDYNKKGCNKKRYILISDKAHYSFIKGAMFTGIGIDSIIKIKTINNKIDIIDLYCKIEEYKPFLIVATAGTTVFGCFDNINKICDICNEKNIWIHIDASYGGGCIFSKKKYLLNGIEKANSITWNPHKSLSVSQQCSIFMVNDKFILQNCFTQNIDYLFGHELYEENLDSGNKYIQCGRKVDVFKLWTIWKIYGDEKFGENINDCIDCAINLYNKMINTNYICLAKPEYTALCFKCIQGTKNISYRIKQEILQSGEICLSYQRNGDFLRIVFTKKVNINNVLKILDFHMNKLKN